jgi:hypothetical protein
MLKAAHRMVKEETLMRSIVESRRGEDSQSYDRFERFHFDELAKAAKEHGENERKFRHDGDEFCLSLYEDAVNARLPAFVATFVGLANEGAAWPETRRKELLRDWKTSSKEFLGAHSSFSKETRLNDPLSEFFYRVDPKVVEEFIDRIQDLDFSNLSRLLEFCEGSWYELKLMPNATPDKLPKKAVATVFVGKSGEKLHFRIFDAGGRRVADRGEDQLAALKAEFEEVKELLRRPLERLDKPISPDVKCELVRRISELCAHQQRVHRRDDRRQWATIPGVRGYRRPPIAPPADWLRSHAVTSLR